MKIEPKIMEHTKSVLKQFGNKYISDNGSVKKNKVISDLNDYDKQLISALLKDDLIAKNYTEIVNSSTIFKLTQFTSMFEYKDFWEDSFTKYSNKIGLTSNDKFIDESTDVVLDYPYKDTVLKASMTKEDADPDVGANEPFLNETIAKPEINELFEPKILINSFKQSVDGISNTYKFDTTDNLIINGNNLIAMESIKKRFAGQVKLIYLDPPYNTGSDSFAYNDRFNQASWLTFMANRLRIAKKIMAEDGYIVIQTDDNEQAYLKVLMDSIFGKNNYVNTVSVLFKNIAGASGGGEDKRLKKNIEFLTIYAKNYDLAKPFHAVKSKTPIDEVLKKYRTEGRSWKYNNILLDPGDKSYIGSTVDGAGNEIKIYRHEHFKLPSIKEIMTKEKLSESEVYRKYADKIYRGTMPQSSIRIRVMDKYKDLTDKHPGLISIDYVPRTGKHKGKHYTQYYSGDKFNLFAWLHDVTSVENNTVYKTEKQGTFWDYVGATKNVNKEGQVSFPDGKKPEELLSKIISMTTNEHDLVLDMFLGSGSTVATAMKLNRQFIGIEQIDSQINLIKQRLSNVINGDQSGISKELNWQGGGSFVYTELMPKNQGYLKDLLAASNTDELDLVFQRMKQGADFDFRVDLEKYENDKERKQLSFDDQKKLLIKMLDKNQLYYNEANIDDANVRDLISNSDYEFNKSFYGNRRESD